MGSQMDPVMKQKVENDAAASLRSLRHEEAATAPSPKKRSSRASRSPKKEALDHHLIDVIARE